jgi:hypothetical protein
MSNLMSSVDQRTQLVVENRLELLLFKLGSRHTFALNVFKVREVITVPPLNTSLSGSFNEAMVQKVGCNRFISKFQPDLLVEVVQQRMREVLKERSPT